MLICISIVAVPGYCSPPARWDVNDELEKAATSVDGISSLNIYIHQPEYKSREEFSWESFLEAGSNLAEDLARLATEVCLAVSSE